MQWLAIAFGGALGAVARSASVGLINHGLIKAGSIAQDGGQAFPWGTLSVNAVGSFLAGLLIVLCLGKWNAHPELHGFLIVGFLGSFTTFSAFSLENLQMIQAGELGKALLYAGISLILCLGAAALGMFLAGHGLSSSINT